MPYKDPERHRAYHKEYARQRYDERMAEAIRRLGGKCARCGGTDDLQLHHPDRGSKRANLTRMWSAPEDVFWDEVAKCQLLCRKHHGEESLRERGQVPAQHGTVSMLRRGCRCPECREAGRRACAAWRARQRASTEVAKRGSL